MGSMFSTFFITIPAEKPPLSTIQTKRGMRNVRTATCSGVSLEACVHSVAQGSLRLLWNATNSLSASFLPAATATCNGTWPRRL